MDPGGPAAEAPQPPPEAAARPPVLPLEVEEPSRPSQPLRQPSWPSRALRASRPSQSRSSSAGSQRQQEAPPEPPPLEIVHALAAEWAAAGRTPQVHEVWGRLGFKGRLHCGGRCVTGPPVVDCRFNGCAWVSIVVPSIFYFAACGPDLWRWSPMLPICTALLLVITVVLLLLTSCTDPGIIPRPALQLLVDSLEDEVREAVGCQDFPTDVSLTEPDPKLQKRLGRRGFDWCRHCRMWQPPRAKHCRDCGCCVLRNDHHCPFVNNCIGQRNYAYFCGMVFAASCLGIAVLGGISVWSTYNGEESNRKLMCALVVGPTCAVVLGLITLLCFHISLVIRGRTTREVLTGRISGDGPTLFGPRGPSLLYTRSEVRFPPMEV